MVIKLLAQKLIFPNGIGREGDQRSFPGSPEVL